MVQQKDRGWAWMCVVGSFYIHFIVFGIMQSFGVIYVELISQFGGSRAEIAWIGSLLSGLVFVFGPVGMFLLNKFGVRVVAIIGAMLACTGCSICFLSDSLLFLSLSFSVLPGIGLSFVLSSTTVTVNQYFDKQRPLAVELSSLGSGVGTLILPPLLQVLIDRFYYKGALLITGGLILNCVVVGALFRPFYTILELKKLKEENQAVQESIRISEEQTKVCFTAKSLLMPFKPKNVSYTLFAFGSVLTSVGLLIPFTHLPDLATELSIPPYQTTWLISSIGVASMFGRLLSARILELPSITRVPLCVFFCMVCGASTMVCPVLVMFETLMAFSTVFGLFFGMFSHLKDITETNILGKQKCRQGFDLVLVLKGIALLFGLPVTGWMYDNTGNYFMSFCFAGGLLITGGALILMSDVIRLCIRSKPENYSLTVINPTGPEHVYDSIFTIGEQHL